MHWLNHILLTPGMDPYFLPVILASLIAGMTAGMTGFYVVAMRIPFIPVCLAHAALLGAVIAVLLNLNQFLLALLVAVACAVLVALTPARKLRMDENISLAVLFSLSMGLIFLAIGLNKDSQTPMLSLLWGSLLFVDQAALIRISVTLALQITLVLFFSRPLQAVLFSRPLASAAGLPQQTIYTIFMAVIALVVTVNLQAVGGLMIFSLIVNPAAAACQLFHGYKKLVTAATCFGGISGIAGFYLSYFSNLPTGACIVIISAVIFLIALALRLILRIQD